MPIDVQDIYFAYTADGNTTIFPYQCRIFAAGNLQVSVAGVLKTLGVDYTVSGAGGNEGGDVTFVPAATPAAAAKVEIERVLTFDRSTDYTGAGNWRPDVVNQDQDYQTALLQQMNAVLSRTIKLPGDAAYAQVLPDAAGRANTLLGFNANGDLELKTASYTIIVQAGAAGAASLTLADASAGPAVAQLPAAGEVIVIKTDATENAVTVTPLEGHTVCREATIDLTLQDEAIHLKFNGTNWYRIG
ncbi:MAG TPA: hypothetical protein DCZ63_08420 [Geobacter sp.]|nr:hypothetical protein [Geobacter sp.]